MMNTQKEKLETLRAELSQRIAKIDQDFHSRQTSSKFSEQVVDGQNDEVLLNLKNEARFELEQIDRALLRIKNEEYGVCSKCHNAISSERLEAVPYATQCMHCTN